MAKKVDKKALRTQIKATNAEINEIERAVKVVNREHSARLKPLGKTLVRLYKTLNKLEMQMENA